MNDERARWSDRLRSIADLTLAGTPWVNPLPTATDKHDHAELSASHTATLTPVLTFRDDAGHRRATDRPFLAALIGATIAREPNTRPWREIPIDEQLWWAVHDQTAPVLDTHSSLVGLAHAPATGPLAAICAGIETRTETELSALHALWRLGRTTPGQHASLRTRALNAARWIVRELQPDNATNHPWAAHVFIELAIHDRSAPASMYAETLAHNSMVAAGRPDTFSALVLLDSSRELLRPQ